MQAGDGCSRESWIQIDFFKEGMKTPILSNPQDLPDRRDVIAPRTREPRFEVQLNVTESRYSTCFYEKVFLKVDSCVVEAEQHEEGRRGKRLAYL